MSAGETGPPTSSAATLFLAAALALFVLNLLVGPFIPHVSLEDCMGGGTRHTRFVETFLCSPRLLGQDAASTARFVLLWAWTVPLLISGLLRWRERR